ncbi:hypothetical protein HanIR_Chr13g0662021 [Helianthus annuus]|nr:hypothetical protein HanIR_Chr13g0662021 [Helianthus annuus]
MHLMLLLPTLVNQSQLKQSPNIRTLTSKRNEKRNISRIIFRILSVRIEIHSPLVTSNHEIITRYVFSDPRAFC